MSEGHLPSGGDAARHRGMALFTVLWLGQVVSGVGSFTASFAIGVELLQATGSVTRFTLYALSGAIPFLLLSPLAGAWADRYERRHMVMLANLGATCGTLALLALVRYGTVTSWHVYPILAFRAACGAFLWPPFLAATTLIVDRRDFGRASGMNSVGTSLGQILGPLLGGALLVSFDLETVLLLDVATFLFAAATLLPVRFPQPATAPSEVTARPAESVGTAWTFVRRRPALSRLLLLSIVPSTALGFVQILFTPLVLGFAGPVALGVVLSFSALGTLAGGLVMTVWGGPAPARRMTFYFFALWIQGLLLLLAGFGLDTMLVTSAAFFYMAILPILAGVALAIWQSKTPPEIQGRVFALRAMVAQGSAPLAFIVAGPLADYVFEPALDVGGTLAPTVGRWLGVGPGRGIALMLILLGLAVLGAVAVAGRSRLLRRLEDEVPDVVEGRSGGVCARRRPGAGVAAALARLGTPAAVAMSLFVLVGAAVAILALRPPAPAAADAAPAEFSAERALRHLEEFASRPHPTGSPALAQARDGLLRRLDRLGLETRVQRTEDVAVYLGVTRMVTVENVMARLRGTSPDGAHRALLLVGHYDSPGNSPGAADNGAAVAALVETARALTAGPPVERDVIFLFTDAEELFLHGARAFVREDPWARDVAVVVNFEARGHGGPVYMFETGRGNDAWIPRFLAAVPRPVASSLMDQVYRLLSNNTDFTVFRDAGYPGFNLAFIEGLTHYHTMLDRPRNLDLASLQHQGSYALGFARHLDTPPPAAASGPLADRVYFNLLGPVVAHYPSALALPSAVLSGLTFLVALALGLRGRRLSPIGLLQGFLAFVGILLLVPVAVTLVWIVLRKATGVPLLMGSTEGAGVFMVALAGLALAVFVLLARFFGRVTGVLNLAGGALLWWLILVILASGPVLPAAANGLFVWPFLAASAVFGFLCRTESFPRWRTVVLLGLGGGPAVLLLAPFIGQLYVGLQSLFQLSGAALVAEVALLGLLIPQLEVMGGRRPGWLPAAAALAGAVLLAFAVWQAPDLYQDSVFYTADADTGEHRWFTFDRAADEWTRQFGFEPDRRESFSAFFPLPLLPLLASPAPVAGLPAPEIKILAEKDGEHGFREVRLRLRASSAVQARTIWFEPATAVPSVRLAGRHVALRGEGDRSPVLQRWPPAPEEEMTVRIRGSGPVTLVAVDQIPGLPRLPGIEPRPPAAIPTVFRILLSDVSLVRRSLSLAAEARGE